MTPNNRARAIRYRQLSLAEADREVLCMSDWLRETPGVRAEPTSNNA
jgi:hypothetical protein